MLINQIAPSASSQNNSALFEKNGKMYSEDLIIPSSCTSICKYAYYSCPEIKSLSISDEVTSIEEYAFYNCTGLTAISLPSNLSSLGESVFWGCSGIKGHVAIPQNVTTIFRNCFFNCTGITSVYLPASVISIENLAFSNCTSLKTVVLTEGIKIIGYYSFSGCSSLTDINIPDSVNELKIRAFQNCSSIKTLHIPSSVEIITATSSENSLGGCTGLEFVTLGDGFHVSINLSASIKYSAQTIADIFNSLYDFTDTNGEYYGQNATITLGTTNLTKYYTINGITLAGLSDVYVVFNEETNLWEVDPTAYFATEDAKNILEIATDKGWTVA